MRVKEREKLKVTHGLPHKQVDIFMVSVVKRDDPREGDEFNV